ncbi:MAG: HNH endonuclease [Elusimicrobiaceae bacterium]|nr:HNH endonuclease [Elusimicrobiaceae bacterium]
MSRNIDEIIKRRLYAESMGRCMNPNCQKELFSDKGDIIEKAHIRPYCETADNSFENLIILCPTCHRDFDKNFAFKADEVKQWKQIREEELNSLFNTKYTTFNDLRDKVKPLLCENKTIYENYYLNGNKDLWNKFEPKILVNNSKLKNILLNNLKLIQSYSNDFYSNLKLVHLFLLHIDEFQQSRLDKNKERQVLFPKEINSLFEVCPMDNSFIPSVESLEVFISKLQNKNQFISISIGVDDPYISICDSGKRSKIYLKDTPRLRQYYYDYNCFRAPSVRLESLNFALKYIKSKGIELKFYKYTNLRECKVKNTKMIFVYEYCLNKVFLAKLCPSSDCIIVNLHNWNGSSCISNEAYEFANSMKVKLLNMEMFYEYINKLQ